MTMHWNHRVVRRRYPEAAPSEAVQYEIHEAYYSDGALDFLTEEPVAVTSDSVEGLRWVLERMLRALDAPIIDYETRQNLEESVDSTSNPSETP